MIVPRTGLRAGIDQSDPSVPRRFQPFGAAAGGAATIALASVPPWLVTTLSSTIAKPATVIRTAAASETMDSTSAADTSDFLMMLLR